MKVAYTQPIFGIGPDMVIAESEMKKMWDSEDEFNFLHFAVNAFTAEHGFENNLNKQDYRLAYRWLRKNSYVRFVVKEIFYSRIRNVRWCEIYVMTGGNVQGIVTSEDGEHFVRMLPDTGKRNEVSHA